MWIVLYWLGGHTDRAMGRFGHWWNSLQHWHKRHVHFGNLPGKFLMLIVVSIQRDHQTTYQICWYSLRQKVGCDWMVDSNTTEDQCGICGGTGETCTTIRGEFNKKMETTDDYFEITTIPSGSRQILIEEIHQSRNFLSIARANSSETFLNGNHAILMPGEFMIDKSMGLYERDNEQEKIKIPGPIPFDLSVKVCDDLIRWSSMLNSSRRFSFIHLIASFFVFLRRFCFVEKAKIQPSGMNTRCRRTTQKSPFTIGN